jgi:hypothetical protein
MTKTAQRILTACLLLLPGLARAGGVSAAPDVGALARLARPPQAPALLTLEALPSVGPAELLHLDPDAAPEAPVLNLACGVGLTIAWHELGHIAMVSITGARVASVSGPSRTGVATVSWTTPREHLSTEWLRSAGGILWTTSGGLGLELLLRTDRRLGGLRPILAATALMMALDRHRYLWSAALRNFTRLGHSSGNDIHNIMRAAFPSSTAIDVAYGVALGLSAVELALRFGSLRRLFDTAMGRRGLSGSPGVLAVPGVYLTGDAVLCGVRGVL